jgi:Superfamily II DNA and RNA helicases
MTFSELNISEPVLKALVEKNYEIPTPIQIQAIPVALSGRDLLGIAQTGTGKTAAFAIPIIQQLDELSFCRKSAPELTQGIMATPANSKAAIASEGMAKVHRLALVRKSKNVEMTEERVAKNTTKRMTNAKEIRALILTPTRELAIQIEECFSDYAKYTSLRHTVIFGGVSQAPQVDKLKRGTDILIATPGRLLDLISQKYISLEHIRHFVLDEADRMLDMGFIHDIKKLLPMLPKSKQTLFFSATMPTAIATLSKSILNKPVRVEVAPVSSVVDTIKQKLYLVEKPQKSQLLINILQKDERKSVLVFSRTKHGADKIARILKKQGIGCDAIHGNKAQNARQRALSDFKSGKTRVIVATDIAARGIDIANLEMVINYDLPDVPETYVHRIGRTGRAGNSGVALTFCSKDENEMLRNIQKLTGKKLNSIPLPA